KQEVRFRDARTVHDFIYGTLHRALNEQIKFINDKSPETENHVRETGLDYKFQNIETVFPYKEQPDTGSSISIGGRYIITEEPGGAILVDIKRAREMIACIKLKQEWSADQIRSRPVLVPLTCQVSVSESELVEQYQPLLEKLGLVIQHSTPTVLL